MRPTVSLLAILLMFTPVASALLASTAPTPAPEAAPAQPDPGAEDNWYTLGEKYGDRFQMEPMPAGLDTVEDQVRHMLHERAMHGRSPAGWIEHVKAQYDVPNVPHAELPRADLTAELLRLYERVGVTVAPVELVQLELQVGTLSPELAGPFAGLLSLVNDAYAEQQGRARLIMDRVVADLDVDSVIVTAEERDAMDALQARLLSAFLAFQAATDGHFPASGGGREPPLFADPTGLVFLGSTGDNAYAPGGTLGDALLIVDPAGNDVYTNNAGGACPSALNTLHRCNRLAVAAVFDAMGDDTYSYSGETMAVQGSGSTGGVGMLVDLLGDDHYEANLVRSNLGPFFMYLDGGAQGFAQAGSALLLDAAGNDHYEVTVFSSQGRAIWAFGQGFGSLGSLGVAIDLGGDDDWLGYGLGGTGGGTFQGLYPQGTGFYGGIGLMLDLGLSQDDYYGYVEAPTTDYYAHGFGAFGGLGILYEDGGNDTYYAVERATSSSPVINPLLNCAFGTGSLGGAGFFIEIHGNDSYYGDTISNRRALTMNEGYGGITAGYGAHVDLEGDDHRVIKATSLSGQSAVATGRGHIFDDGNIVGNYLDAGGDDVYGGGPGSNNAVWFGGADQAVVPGGVI